MPAQTKLTATFSAEDHKAIRYGSMRGQLNAMVSYQRDVETGETTFWVNDPKKFCDQLELLVDFGAITCHEVFFGVDGFFATAPY